MKKVLLVEDERIIRRGLVLTFDWHSHDCCIVGEASDGLEASAMIDDLQPDIVITDIRMPNMTGIELLETCKYRTNQLSIILSSYDEFDYAKQAMKLGAFDYLLKPLNHDELSATLKKAVTHLDESGSVGKKSEKAEWFFAGDAKPSSISSSIKRVLDFIDENFAEKLTVQELADHIDKSPTYLHGKFKKEMNQTLSQYINKVRIQKSIEQMRNGEDHIYSIAQSVGYSDYKYFTTVFKKYTNHSPTSFIKSLRL